MMNEIVAALYTLHQSSVINYLLIRLSVCFRINRYIYIVEYMPFWIEI